MKIITYKSPYQLNELECWTDIKRYPHLCVSQTLVEGLKAYYGRDSFSLICTIDTYLKHFYNKWHGNNENTLFQFIHLSNEINKIKNDKLRNSFIHNKNDILQSIRFIIECGIKPSDIVDVEGLTAEQQQLIELYENVFQFDCFQTLFHQNDRELDGLYSCAKEILMKECERKVEASHRNTLEEATLFQFQNEDGDKESDRDLKYLHDLLTKLSDHIDTIPFDKVFIHGVHQFTPMIYKFVDKLQALGVEVIFIFNYCEEFRLIYKTWDEVYKWTRRDFDQYGNLKSVIPRTLGENIGLVFEGQLKDVKRSSEILYKFNNLTSFTDYVSPIYEEAKKSVPSSKIASNLNVIARMKEQFYAVDGSEINSLLKVYFPEHFGGRHFLSYPIGQFILGLYNMWNQTKKEIIINDRDLKECLALNIWKFREGLTPLQMYYDMSLYFKGANTFAEFEERLNKIQQVAKSTKNENKQQISRLSFFSYQEEDVENFKAVIHYLRNFAEQLFRNGSVDLKEHYQGLINYISENVNAEISEKEQSFIKEIQQRLNNMEIENVVANVEDIKETLHFYLTANEEKDQEAEWIVRDFEQIDGGVLLAKATEEKKRYSFVQNPNYHFAGLSNENLLNKAKKSLPFPLSIEMIDGMNDVATIVATCKKEYVHFLRYSLFYGTYFLSPINEINLSFIEDLGDNVAKPYSIFEVLNIPIESYSEKQLFDEGKAILLPYNDCSVVPVDPKMDDSMKRSASACYLRFLFNHCLDESTTFNDEFNLYYLAQLLAVFRSVLNKRRREQPVDYEQTERQFEKLYQFMDEMDFKKIRKMLPNYEKHDLDDNYVNTKLEFKYCKWTKSEEDSTNMFSHITNAYRMKDRELNDFIKNLDRFINDDQFSFLPAKHNEKICDVCNQKYVCCYGLKLKENDDG